jgi:hypothetical protein
MNLPHIALEMNRDGDNRKIIMEIDKPETKEEFTALGMTLIFVGIFVVAVASSDGQ